MKTIRASFFPSFCVDWRANLVRWLIAAKSRRINHSAPLFKRGKYQYYSVHNLQKINYSSHEKLEEKASDSKKWEKSYQSFCNLSLKCDNLGIFSNLWFKKTGNYGDGLSKEISGQRILFSNLTLIWNEGPKGIITQNETEIQGHILMILPISGSYLQTNYSEKWTMSSVWTRGISCQTCRLLTSRTFTLTLTPGEGPILSLRGGQKSYWSIFLFTRDRGGCESVSRSHIKIVSTWHQDHEIWIVLSSIVFIPS